MKTFFPASCIVFAAFLTTVTIPHVRAAEDAPQIAATLQQSRSALGAAALKRGRELLVNGTATVNGLNGTGTLAAEIGGARFTEQMTTPPIVTADGYDGNVFWNRDHSGLVWTDGGDADRSREVDTAYAAADTLFVPGSGAATIRWGGMRSAGGRSFAVLLVQPLHSLIPMQFWIDSSTHLPARYVIPIGATAYEQDVSDYRAVDGLLVPHRIVSSDGEGNSSAITVRSARLVAVRETQFAKPASKVADFTINDRSGETSVPFDVLDHHVYVNVSLNGKGPYRFVLDTGGSNVIDPAVAKEIKTATSGSARDFGTGNSTESSSYTTVESLQFGKAIVRRQVFSVEPMRKGFGVDGLIGFEVLARYVTTFDYAKRTLTFSMPNAARVSRGRSIHFVLWGTMPQIPCSIDGIASDCTVDTGDANSVQMFAPFVAHHPAVIPVKHSAVGVNGYGVGGGHRGFMGRLKTLQLASFTLHDLVAGYSTQNSGVFESPFLAANLGGGVWDRFTITFDYARGIMALEPNAHFAARDTFDRSGMVLIDKAGKVVVYSVRRNTPAAEARFAKDDVIVSVDGVAATSAAQVRRILHGAPGTVLHFGVRSKTGVNRTVTLTLHDWV